MAKEVREWPDPIDVGSAKRVTKRESLIDGLLWNVVFLKVMFDDEWE